MVFHDVYSNHSLKTKVTELTEIPRDAVMGLTVITITGETDICIENHKGILEYTDSNIRIRTKSGLIILSGKELLVDSFSNDEMIIKGMIKSIEFKNQGA